MKKFEILDKNLTFIFLNSKDITVVEEPELLTSLRHHNLIFIIGSKQQQNFKNIIIIFTIFQKREFC